MDDLLDGHSPVQCLEDERLAKIVQDAFLHFAGERYKLLAYVVMPSHHHWLFLPNPDWSEKFLARQKQSGRLQTPREAISHSIQSYTANECNRVLDQTGRFWQHETYDHYARDEAEMFRIIAYIEQNPVKTGFVTKPAEYLWSSARLRAELNLAVGEPIQLS